MNDFTKEELENILNGNVWHYPHTYQSLRDKIQSLIHNYCEHECTYDGSGCVQVCRDCGEIVW